MTVEASSPALIEKVRSVASDGTGQYRIVDLRPGVYAVTFTLTGFRTVKREALELTGSGTITVNADLQVGTLEETITVTGESPVVDTQSSTRQAVLDGELVAIAPAARSWNGIMLLMPGVTGDPNTMQLNPSDDSVRHSRRAGAGGTATGRWNERRRLARRCRRIGLHGRYRQRAGGHLCDIRRARRGRNGRPVHELSCPRRVVTRSTVRS